MPAVAPPRFWVAPFENRSGVRALDWMIAGAPFELAGKTAALLGLDPAGGALALDEAAAVTTPAQVAAAARARDARYVVTGWVERPNWELRMALTVWRVEGDRATPLGEVQRQAPMARYHEVLGGLAVEAWRAAGLAADPARAAAFARPLATDLYAVTLMGRGLGHLVGALSPASGGAAPAVDLKAAEHDLERATFIDPKLAEAQRLLGEAYLRAAPGDARAAARAAGKFAYAVDLAPDDAAALAASARASAAASKHELAAGLWQRVVALRPWDLEARARLGAARWEVGDAAGAERELERVIARRPGDLASRRVLSLIHAARGDTSRLIAELEAIALRAPADLEIKAELATAYGAVGRWPQATAALEAIAALRPGDVALLCRIGDAHRRLGDVDGALAWYGRAARLAPELGLPAFAAAQALFDAGRLDAARAAYTALQRFRAELPAALAALGLIALRQDRPDDAAWYLRRAAREAPRSLRIRQAVVAAELARRDAAAALAQLEPALAAWPDDGPLRYLAGVARALAGDRVAARAELVAALARAPGDAAAAAALGVLDAGGALRPQFAPALERPWGDAEAVGEALRRFAATEAAMATARAAFQASLLGALGALGQGPLARRPGVRPRCPVARVAPAWQAGQEALRRYQRLGVELEAAARFVARHDEAGVTAGLLPAARAEVFAARRAYRTALADVGELRAEWARGLRPELAAAGCSDALLAAAAADPRRYAAAADDDVAAAGPARPPAKSPRARATFVVDNARCPDPVDVWVDGVPLGQVAPGRRSALVADGGERTLCLLPPGAAACGDLGTVRQVYLHDGWSVTLHCPR